MPLNESQREFWNVIKYEYDINKELKTNPDVIEAIKISQRLRRVIEPLACFIFALAKRRINNANYVHLEYVDDLVQEATRQMITSVMRFNTNKSDNPYAYLSTCCTSAVINYQNREIKYQQIKQILADGEEIK